MLNRCSWLALAVLLLVACSDDDSAVAPTTPRAQHDDGASFTPTAELRLPTTRVDWIAIGGGAEPSSSQVSLEQDLAVVRDVLGPTRGVVLHAGGRGAASVMVLAETDLPGDPLALRLGALFDPRESRESSFRASRLDPAGPSTREAFDAALTLALLAPDDAPPLVVYINGHGEPGDPPETTLVRLWGGFPLTAEDLADRLDDAARPTRIVITSCFSGGFDALAFRAADVTAGAAPGDRCGLFATTPDREASGCDPNPDRAAQESFALHFVHALRGEDTRGRPLPRESVDFDHDGRVTLYEAHARARIAARSIDIPTTTSERWLRERAPAAPVSPPLDDWAVESIVIRALSGDLELATADAARARLTELEGQLEEIDARLAEAEADLDEAWAALRVLLLERWPTLDDSFDPRFASAVASAHAEIDHLLDTTPEALAYAGAAANVDSLRQGLSTLDETYARVTRLVRAHDNVLLASRLRATGGPDYEVFQKLRACEATPVDATPAP